MTKAQRERFKAAKIEVCEREVILAALSWELVSAPVPVSERNVSRVLRGMRAQGALADAVRRLREERKAP